MLKMLKMLNCLGEIDPPQKMGESVSPRQFNIFNIFNISPVLSIFVNNVLKTREMLNIVKNFVCLGPILALWPPELLTFLTFLAFPWF